MEEKWVDIQGYEGKYQISNTGKVKSLAYNNTNQEKMLQFRINNRGVYTVNLWKNNKAKQFGVGQLVAMHFLQKNNEEDVVIHIGDKLNDNVDNLKYVSLAEAQYNKKVQKKKQVDSIDKLYSTGEIREKKMIAEQHGIKVHQLYKRLYEGWSIEEATTIPIERQERILSKKLYEYKGKWYSVKQLAKINGINENAIYKRLQRRWSVEEAVETPLSKFRKEKVK